MSVPSRNTMVTTDRPYLEIERTCSVRGIPAMARSIGTVTYCSTSTGDSAGDEVMIWTCTLVISGTASMGRLRAAFSPNSRNKSVATSTTGRLRSDQSTKRERSAMSLLVFGEGGLEHGALEREHAVHHHLFALLQPSHHLDLAPGRLAQRELVQLV